ncbi:ATP-binding protein [Candidatus Magnetomoraceae bacterium gMMP-15]
MKRFIDQELIKWKKSKRRKPLIIRGARQVGKTYSIKEFAQNSFNNLALVDLERNPDWHRVFNENLNAIRICTDLEILLQQKIRPGKTLLFIDEIQACPRAITALRYFYEEIPDLHVVAAGSLLEFAMQDISVPVGRIKFLNLYPLTFAEYLKASGNEEAAHIILGKPGKVSNVIHDFLCKELRNYFFTGGMPESVSAYIQTKSIQESFEVQAEICDTYRMDFAKYKPHADKNCLNAVFTAIAQSVGQQIKYAKLADGYSNPTLKKTFDLLCLANVVKKIPSVNPSGLPLGASASAKIFKALMLDIGLMRYLTGMPVNLEYSKADLLGIYQGAMAEQFVGQEMLVSQNQDLYYWSRQAKSSSAEVDFVCVVNGQIHPVEVKSGPSGRLKSLHLFFKTYKNCKKGIVFSTRPYAELTEQNIIFMPLYFVFSGTISESKYI